MTQASANAGTITGKSGATVEQHSREVKQGERFQFGKNWASFLAVLSDDRINKAVKSLQQMLQVETLQGKTFLDIGSGSGLFSLAAWKLGAKVHSFDYDPGCVGCTQELRQRYAKGDPSWVIEQGSAMDKEYLKSLGTWDIVYSWGVLHHTNALWESLGMIAPMVNKGGRLWIALYNDQGRKSRFWWHVKRTYNSGTLGRWFIVGIFYPIFFIRGVLSSIVFRRNTFTSYGKNRGMSIFHDWRDWLGGFPYEVSKVEDLLAFFRARGFNMVNLKTTNSLACNELVFERVS